MSSLVEKASRTTSKALTKSIDTKYLDVTFHIGSEQASIEVYHAKELPSDLKEWIFDLFERNMKELYETSQSGYDPDEKREELFHRDSRFLIIRLPRPETSASSLIGYLMWRFDWEEGPEHHYVMVAYCYELQVENAHRKKGVASDLMDILIGIGREKKMEKVMVTVFKSNRGAIKFYERIGFEEDEISPEEDAEVDYLIMSRSLVGNGR